MDLLKAENVQDVSIVIDETEFNKIKDYTAACYPREVSALLFGIFLNCKGFIREIIIVPNLSRSQNQFQISTENKEKAVLKANHPYFGVYHSHINDTEPSQNDINEMKKLRNIWLIGSLNKNQNKITVFKLNAYCHNNNKLFNLKLEGNHANNADTIA